MKTCFTCGKPADSVIHSRIWAISMALCNACIEDTSVAVEVADSLVK